MITKEDLNSGYPIPIDKYWKILKEAQKDLFNSRIIMVQVRYTDFQLRHMRLTKELVENHMVQLLAKEIAPLLETICITNVAPLDHRDMHPDTIYRKEAMLLLPGQLKHIVEVMIKMIPEDELKKIRNQE